MDAVSIMRGGPARARTEAAALQAATDDPTWVRWFLIAVSVTFLSLFLFVPLAAVFAEAFRKGFGAYLASFRDPQALAAIRLTLLTAAIGAVFALFIPSSGGQWAIQGYVTSKAAMEVGVSVQRGILAMSVGDHMGNLTSPFWYVIIAGVAHVDFRSFFGYGLLFAAIWFVIGAVVFTFAPC